MNRQVNSRSACKTSTLLGRQLRKKVIPVQHKQFNTDQLNWKYDAYRNGTPNIYEKNVDKLKFTAINSELKVLELPVIDYLLKELKCEQKDRVNKRNYDMYPSMRHKYANKFRDLVSDKQEIRDFISWFEESQDSINKKDISEAKKFHLRQSLIASGFNEMISQIISISRPRSQILKMLWNRQNEEISQIMNSLHDHSTQKEKKYLENLKALHVDYQDQILHLTKQNYKLKRKYEDELLITQCCVHTLRTLKKKAKKYESLIKQMSRINNTLKYENFSLLEENSRLLMQTKGISSGQAKILSLRILQIQQEKKQIKTKPSYKKTFNFIHAKSEDLCTQTQSQIIEEKKQQLLDFLKKRIKQNGEEKHYILSGQFSDDEDQFNEGSRVESYLKQIINTTQIKTQITNISQDLPLKNCGIGTEEKKYIEKQEKQVQVQIIKESKKFRTDRVVLTQHVSQEYEREGSKSNQKENEKEMKRFSSFVNPSNLKKSGKKSSAAHQIDEKRGEKSIR